MTIRIFSECLDEGCARDFVLHGRGEVLQPVSERGGELGCRTGLPGVEGVTACAPVCLWDDF